MATERGHVVAIVILLGPEWLLWSTIPLLVLHWELWGWHVAQMMGTRVVLTVGTHGLLRRRHDLLKGRMRLGWCRWPVVSVEHGHKRVLLLLLLFLMISH